MNASELLSHPKIDQYQFFRQARIANQAMRPKPLMPTVGIMALCGWFRIRVGRNAPQHILRSENPGFRPARCSQAHSAAPCPRDAVKPAPPRSDGPGDATASTRVCQAHVAGHQRDSRRPRIAADGANPEAGGMTKLGKPTGRGFNLHRPYQYF